MVSGYIHMRPRGSQEHRNDMSSHSIKIWQAQSGFVFKNRAQLINAMRSCFLYSHELHIRDWASSFREDSIALKKEEGTPNP